MSIENEIKKLRESIEGLTNAIIEYNKEKVQIRVSEPTPIKVETKEKNITPKLKENKESSVDIVAPNIKVEKEEVIEINKITNDMVKQLGKEKMAAGVDRSKIKSIITSLAGPDASIADLDESNIEECYNKISELQPK
jgi:hypothetical protein